MCVSPSFLFSLFFCPTLPLRTEAFRRFAVLWHLSREVSARRHISRSFDRCLLLMLDCLRDPSGPLHAVARTWLTHTLQRGDVNRCVPDRAVPGPPLLAYTHPESPYMG